MVYICAFGRHKFHCEPEPADLNPVIISCLCKGFFEVCGFGREMRMPARAHLCPRTRPVGDQGNTEADLQFNQLLHLQKQTGKIM